MSKSSFTVKEIIGLVITEISHFYQSSNFDRGEIRYLLRESAISLKAFVQESYHRSLYRKTTTLSASFITIDNVASYDLSLLTHEIDLPKSVFIPNVGRIGILDYDDLLGAVDNPEFNKLPVPAMLGEELRVYFGQLTPGNLDFTYEATIAFPGSENEKVDIPNRLVPLFVLWTAKIYLNKTGRPVSDQLNLAIKERAELLFGKIVNA